jgi:hypothetical protein
MVPPSLPLIPKVRRPIKQRQPFDVFEDQYVKLKSIAKTEKEFENGRRASIIASATLHSRHLSNRRVTEG